MKGKKPTLKKLDLLIRNVELKMLPKSVSTVLNSPQGDGVSVRGAGPISAKPPSAHTLGQGAPAGVHTSWSRWVRGRRCHQGLPGLPLIGQCSGLIREFSWLCDTLREWPGWWPIRLGWLSPGSQVGTRGGIR